MKLENITVHARGRPSEAWLPFVAAALPLRFSLVDVTNGDATIEATIVHAESEERPAGCDRHSSA